MRNVTTNEQDIDKEEIECYADAIRDACELDKYDSGTVDDYGLLLNEAIEGGIFVYVPRPEDFQNGLAPGFFARVMFTTGGQSVRVQSAKILSAKHQHEAKDME